MWRHPNAKLRAPSKTWKSDDARDLELCHSTAMKVLTNSVPSVSPSALCSPRVLPLVQWTSCGLSCPTVRLTAVPCLFPLPMHTAMPPALYSILATECKARTWINFCGFLWANHDRVGLNGAGPMGFVDWEGSVETRCRPSPQSDTSGVLLSMSQIADIVEWELFESCLAT